MLNSSNNKKTLKVFATANAFFGAYCVWFVAITIFNIKLPLFTLSGFPLTILAGVSFFKLLQIETGFNFYFENKRWMDIFAVIMYFSFTLIYFILVSVLVHILVVM